MNSRRGSQLFTLTQLKLKTDSKKYSFTDKLCHGLTKQSEKTSGLKYIKYKVHVWNCLRLNQTNWHVRRLHLRLQMCSLRGRQSKPPVYTVCNKTDTSAVCNSGKYERPCTKCRDMKDLKKFTVLLRSPACELLMNQHRSWFCHGVQLFLKWTASPLNLY